MKSSWKNFGVSIAVTGALLIATAGQKAQLAAKRKQFDRQGPPPDRP
ncbi:MAG TPA: hypothetical protein VHQ95_21330 [Pyrinomonadaceae bacterium]|jgi:hypothetical protein|nr:hypothetical protein [Pyrinomonadaceae bacterium]